MITAFGTPYGNSMYLIKLEWNNLLNTLGRLIKIMFSSFFLCNGIGGKRVNKSPDGKRSAPIIITITEPVIVPIGHNLRY